MSQVAIQNYIGRDYSVPFVVGDDVLNVQTVILKKGLNLLNGEVWDKIKSNPMIKRLLDTSHEFCLMRTKQIDGDPKDTQYLTLRKTYNLDNEKHKMIEVRDFRSAEVAPKTKIKE